MLSCLFKSLEPRGDTRPGQDSYFKVFALKILGAQISVEKVNIKYHTTITHVLKRINIYDIIITHLAEMMIQELRPGVAVITSLVSTVLLLSPSGISP